MQKHTNKYIKMILIKINYTLIQTFFGYFFQKFGSSESLRWMESYHRLMAERGTYASEIPGTSWANPDAKLNRFSAANRVNPTLSSTTFGLDEPSRAGVWAESSQKGSSEIPSWALKTPPVEKFEKPWNGLATCESRSKSLHRNTIETNLVSIQKL